MSGICGIFSVGAPVPASVLKTMTNTIRHRGPDDEGYFVANDSGSGFFSGEHSQAATKNRFPGLADDRTVSKSFGYRKLNKYEQADEGFMPLEINGCYLVLNGHIYNTAALAAKLKANNIDCKTGGQEEVFLKCFIAFGVESIRMFDGMFAAAVYDSRSRKLWLIRDRFGIKPLFYRFFKDAVCFASEIKAVLQFRPMERQVNWEGLYLNFTYLSTVSPHTCFKDIFSLKPGHYAEIDTDSLQANFIQYWELPLPGQTAPADYVETTKELLIKSILDSAQGEDPKALMLSGGMDSTMMAAVLSTHNIYPNAITIHSPESIHDAPNAALLAKRYGFAHEILEVDFHKSLQQLEEDIAYYEEPYNTVEISMDAMKYAKERGYGVILSGIGGDEIFASYNYLFKWKRWNKIKHFTMLAPLLPSRPLIMEKIKDQLQIKDIKDFYRKSMAAMRRSDREKLFKNKYGYDAVQIPPAYAAHPFTAYYYQVMKVSFGSHHVYRDDLSAMRFGIELRSGFMHNDLFEYVYKLPINLRFDGATNKPLLQKIAGDYLPKELIDLKKTGFAFPTKIYIEQVAANKAYVWQKLDKLKQRGIFNNSVIDGAMQYQRLNIHYLRIWQLLTCELWFEKYFDNMGVEIRTDNIS